MIRLILIFVIFCLFVLSCGAREKTHTSGGYSVVNPTYYFNYGYLNSWEDTRLYAPYIGVGMRMSLFSIAAFARVGLSVQHKTFIWTWNMSRS